MINTAKKLDIQSDSFRLLGEKRFSRCAEGGGYLWNMIWENEGLEWQTSYDRR